MITKKRFALNRIISPGMSLEEFFRFTSGLGLSKVELRNDINDGRILDGMDPAEAARMASEKNIRVISINALQKFNLAVVRAKARDELMQMLDIAAAITCPAIVLCPNNDPSDARSSEQRFAETVESLAVFGPFFEKAGILGYIEPLGFGISSLASLISARDAIKESGFGCYKVLVDTFHHYIGPDSSDILGADYPVGLTGLVHISGVESDIPPSDYRDAHRVLVGPSDRMHSKKTMEALDRQGYVGDYSFEPFAVEIQALSGQALASAIRDSLEYLTS